MPSAGGGPGGPQYIIQLFVRGRIFDKHRDYGTQGLRYTFHARARGLACLTFLRDSCVRGVTGAVWRLELAVVGEGER